MKLVRPWTLGPFALFLSTFVRWTMCLGNYRYHFDDSAADPRRSVSRGIYLFWHEMMLFPAYAAHAHGRRDFVVLVSRNIDGELIARILKMLGFSCVRGSTSRAGLSALRSLMRKGKINHLAITPDGPRGPRRVVQSGAIYLASRTAMPIYPSGFAFRFCWRAGSWDRMAIPIPCTYGYGVIGKPIFIPPDIPADQIEHHRELVQQAMDQVQARAEHQAGAHSSTNAAEI
jgi:lysophospholipid acyltransferase (LPLAT)-like uncharacterized protein